MNTFVCSILLSINSKFDTWLLTVRVEESGGGKLHSEHVEYTSDLKLFPSLQPENLKLKNKRVHELYKPENAL